MEKVGEKGTTLGSWKINWTQVFVSKLSKIGWPILWTWVGRECCLWKFTVISKLGNCFVKHCDINFQTREKSPQYYTYAKLLKLPGTALPTLDLNSIENTNTVTYPYPTGIEKCETLIIDTRMELTKKSIPVQREWIEEEWGGRGGEGRTRTHHGQTSIWCVGWSPSTLSCQPPWHPPAHTGPHTPPCCGWWAQHSSSSPPPPALSGST